MRPKANQAAGAMQEGSAVSGPNRTERPCYLETMTERDVGWYRGLGFKVREAGIRFVPGGPPNWTMIRHPVRDQAGRDRESRGSGGAQRGETR